ncbi:MAG TPA: amidohydrolase family protein [Usitatibacter sp.]|nr:amidohydrolase family protein [Usitatibacter sp.]
MRRHLHAAVSALAGAIAATAIAADPAAFLLTGKRVYPSPDERAIDDGALLLQGGKIAAVGARKGISARGAATREQCNGGFIAAGFQNSHVHFIGEPWKDSARRPAADVSRAMADMLTRFGYTTVVDIASDRDNTLALRERVEKGEVAGPRILTAGWALFPPGGLPIYLDHFPREFRERLPKPPSAEAAVQVVRQNVAAGADATKLFLATPQPRGRLARMPLEIARAAVEESHARGKPVFAHPTDEDGVREAMAAEVDILAHSTLGAKALWSEAFLREVIASRIAIIPTLKLLGYELRKEGVPADISARLIDVSVDQVKAFKAAGGEVLFGTDVGYMTDFDPAEEYVLLARAGLTPMQILATLTTVPAAR